MTDVPDSEKIADKNTSANNILGDVGTSPSWLKSTGKQYKKAYGRYDKIDTGLHGLLSKFSVREYFYITIFLSCVVFGVESGASIGETVYLTGVVTAASVITLELAHFLSKRSAPLLTRWMARMRKQDLSKNVTTSDSQQAPTNKSEVKKEDTKHTS